MSVSAASVRAVRVDIRAILRDPARRRELMVRTIYATMLREDPMMTMERAESAYDVVAKEKNHE